MFTDIAGFTAVMGEDGDLGMELIRTNRKLQRPLIEKYGGKLLKEIGDGTLVQFESAYQAVKCGIEIQQKAVSHLKRIRPLSFESIVHRYHIKRIKKSLFQFFHLSAIYEYF